MKRKYAVLCILAGTVGDRVYRRTERKYLANEWRIFQRVALLQSGRRSDFHGVPAVSDL